MRTVIKKRALVVGAAVTVAAAVAVTALPAHADSTSGWRKAFARHYGPSRAISGYETVVATSPHDAWAIGSSDERNGMNGRDVAAHWNGRAWRSVPLPATAYGWVSAASASAPGNVWAVTTQGQVLHFNGSKWTVKQFPGAGGWPSGTFTGVTALSATDVWVFGGAGVGGATGGTAGAGAGGTWQYNGKTWKQWKTGPVPGLFQASAVSPSSIWAVGRLASGSNGVVHFTGKTWQVVTAKALQGLQVDGIVALSDRNVWVTASGNNLSVSVLLHYDGTQWARIAAPKGFQPSLSSRPISDGHGGLYYGTYRQLIHRSAGGAWTASAEPSWVEGLTAIPGASGLWASGTLTPLSGTGSSAAIWAYGSV